MRGRIVQGRSGGVLVVHPGVQHSRRLAAALYKAGLLARLVTSNNGALGGLPLLPRSIRARLKSRATPEVPYEKVSTIPIVAELPAIIAPALPDWAGERLAILGSECFERLAVQRVKAEVPAIVTGFETACRFIFKAVRETGSVRVLDAASVHHSWQPAGRSVGLERSVSAVKDEEIALADHVVVLSTYARDSYVEAGVPAERISVIAPGATLGQLERPSKPQNERARVRFIFAGNIKRAKGVDLLISAFAALPSGSCELVLAGALIEPTSLPSRLPEGCTWLGKLDPASLTRAYASADVLVLPSRCDGFGFVVTEAMSMGLPVIVSSAVGAKDFVTPGRNGWLFQDGDVAALISCLQMALDSHARLMEMGYEARRSVSELTWMRYDANVRALYERLLRGAEPAQPPR
jgi:glycosyltransferase involved in cell wall biosynthesis